LQCCGVRLTDLGSLAGCEKQAAHEIIACSGSRERQQHPSLYSKEQQDTEGGDYTPLLRALAGPYLDPVFSSGHPPLPSTGKTLVNWSKFSREPPRWLGAGALFL